MEEEAVAVLPIGAAAASAETVAIETTQAEAQLVSLDAQIDQAVDTAAALEEVQTGLRALTGKGGATEEELALITVAVEGLTDLIHVSRPIRVSMEDFGSPIGRIRATQRSMESVGEKVKEIWQKIVEMVKRSIQWFKDFYAKIFDEVGKLKKRAEEVQRAAVAIKTNTPKQERLKAGKLFPALYIGEAVPDVATALGSFTRVAQGVYTRQVVQLDAARMLTAELEKSGARLETFDLSPPTAGLEEVSRPQDLGFNVPDGVSMWRSPELFGGKAVIAYTIPKGKVDASLLDKAGGEVMAFNPKAKMPEAQKELKTLTPDQCRVVAKEVVELIGAIEKYKSTAKNAEDAKKKLLAAVEKFAKNPDNLGGEDNTYVQIARKLATTIPRLIDQPSASFTRYAVSTMRSLLYYVEDSIKQYD
jgi:hypothetical protein